MNPHFSYPFRGEAAIPRRCYGRIDHVEANSSDSTTMLFAFDLVDADWFDRQDYKALRLNANGGVQGPAAALAGAPLFRLEVESGLHVKVGSTVSDTIAENEAWMERQGWIAFELEAGTGPMGGTLYAGLFAPPVPVLVTGTLVHGSRLKELDYAFSLDDLPEADAADIISWLGELPAEYLHVFDVGQGNANALADADLYPVLYYDLGAGVYRNASTTPPLLRFCFTRVSTIVLSHWDADHWAGAYATSINGAYPALGKLWIAPVQKGTPLHAAFAHDVMAHGGLVCRYDPGAAINSAVLQNGRTLQLWRGQGSNRNNSGLVLHILNGQNKHGWLLTGDCDYHYFPPAVPALRPAALVAPHHGATLHSQSKAPQPAPTGYRRLIYSYGPDNAHGKSSLSHPTVAGVALHHAAGWRHTASYRKEPGHHLLPGKDARATSFHAPLATRGGVVVGWSGPAPAAIPCCTGGTAAVAQS